nr:PREDICTED: interleukin-15-like isoform X1 [Lepisosteus oculatus]
MVCFYWFNVRRSDSSFMRNEVMKSQVSHVYIYCCFHLFLGCPLTSEAWLSLFFLSCVYANMPTTEALDQALREMQTCLESNLSLLKSAGCVYYTPEDYDTDCTNTLFECYILEMEVIIFELDQDYESVHSLQTFLEHAKKKITNDLKNLGTETDSSQVHHISGTQEISTGIFLHCKRCEEYEEKTAEAFLSKFQTFLQHLHSIGYNMTS